jgi:hypothetical protein
MAILTRANEICEPLDDSLLARQARSFGLRSDNTSGKWPEREMLKCSGQVGSWMNDGKASLTAHDPTRTSPAWTRDELANGRLRSATGYFAGSRKLARSVPTMIFPMNPPS